MQVERALDDPPSNYERLLAPRQTGVRVLSVDISATPSSELITVDLSQRALTYEPSGNIEPLLGAIIQATASAIGPKQRVEYTFTIEGLPVDQFLPRPARLSREAQSSMPEAVSCSSVLVTGCTGMTPWPHGTCSGHAFEALSKMW
jgi:hypothetical protein